MTIATYDSSSGGTPPILSTSGLTNSTWNTVTVTQAVGQSAVTILVQAGSGGSPTIGVRQTGQTITPTATLPLGAQVQLTVPVNGLGQFDLFSSQFATSNIAAVYLLATHGPEFVALATPVNLAAVTASYASFNVSANVPSNATAVLLAVSGATSGMGTRKNGSTDDFGNTNESGVYRTFIVGIDASQIFQAKGSGSQVPILIGYWVAGIVWHTNTIAGGAFNQTPASAGSNQNIAAGTGDVGPLAFLYDMTASVASWTYTLSKQGSGLSLASQPSGKYHGQALAANPSQINMSTVSTTTLYELAYFTNVTTFTPFTQTLFFVTDTLVQQ